MGLAAPDGDDEGEAGGKGTAATPLSAMNRKDPSRVGVQMAKTRAAVRGAIQRGEAGEGVASGKRATAVKVWVGRCRMLRVMGTQLLKAITFVKIIGTHFLESQIMPIRIHMHDYVTKPNICLMNMMQDNINIYHYRIRDKPKIKTFSQPRILDNFIIDLQWSTLIQLQSTCDVLPPLPLQVCNKFLTYTICRETHQ